MSYHATITANSSEFRSDLGSLRSSLASTNWAMRVMGIPPEYRKAMTEIRKAIQIIRTLQMVSQGGGITSAISMGLRMAGFGGVSGGLGQIRKLSKLTGGFN